MWVGHSTPGVIRYHFRTGPEDLDRGKCLWADFYLDPERGSLMIMSDCGNYGYRWPEVGWDFIDLMETVHKDYLLNKLCHPGTVDVEATIERCRDALEGIPERSIKKRIQDLRGRFDEYDLTDSPDTAMFLVDKWNDDWNLNIDCAYECVKTDYSSDQKRIVEIFETYIQPMIREAVEGAQIGHDPQEDA